MTSFNPLTGRAAGVAALHTLQQTRAEAKKLNTFATAVADLAGELSKAAATLPNQPQNTSASNTEIDLDNIEDSNQAVGVEGHKATLENIEKESKEVVGHAKTAGDLAEKSIQHNKWLSRIGYGSSAVAAAVSTVSSPLFLLIPAVTAVITVGWLEHMNLNGASKALKEIREIKIDSTAAKVDQLKTIASKFTLTVAQQEQLDGILKQKEELFNNSDKSPVISSVRLAQQNKAQDTTQDTTQNSKKISLPLPHSTKGSSERLQEEIKYTVARVKKRDLKQAAVAEKALTALGGARSGQAINSTTHNIAPLEVGNKEQEDEERPTKGQGAATPAASLNSNARSQEQVPPKTEESAQPWSIEV